MADPDQYNSGRTADAAEALDIGLAHIVSGLRDLYATEDVWDRFLQLDEWHATETSNGAIIDKRDSGATTLSDYPFNAPWMNDFVTSDADLYVTGEILASAEIQRCWDSRPDIDPGPLRECCSRVGLHDE